MTHPDITASDGGGWRYLFLAWLLALFASLAALFIGEVVGQAPCSLCWHQRAFMFPLAIILAVACYRGDRGAWRYALPLAGLGALVAGFHSLLYAGFIPEGIQPCSQGPSCASAEMMVLGLLPLPYLSFAAFGLIVASLLASKRKSTS